MEAKIRLIPAGAGNIARRGPSASKAGAHPRRCGENGSVDGESAAVFGSSPQVRGKHSVPERMTGHARVIPAGVGKTGLKTIRMALSAAHPRRCGENIPSAEKPIQWVGSSPQVRGKQHLKTIATIAGRLIPAGAGKTGACCGACVGDSAHPRRCGENPSTLSLQVSRFGSSPQVRGKLYGVRALLSSSGLIPAGAGKTVARMRGIRGRAAHPRRCGENYYPVC